MSNPNDRTVMFSTICRDCIFAKFEEGKQTGCEFNRLEKYDKMGLLEKQDDGPNSFYKINTLCQKCRNSDWKKEHEEKGLLARLEKENEITQDFILVLSNFDPLESLRDSIKSLVNTQTKITSINIISAQFKIDEIRKMLGEEISGIPYQIAIDITYDYKKSIDNLVKKSKSFYYSVFFVGFNFKTDYNSILNNAILEEMEHVSMILPESNGNGLTVQVLLHNKCMGNRDALIEEKVHELAKQQDNISSITTWEYLCKKTTL